ncbi:mucoidy inhibitor MuiA family protein [bacterium]|nr:mucoidy inhibitor MuiA family protein [candidate division CSSED10-310 bacterium]
MNRKTGLVAFVLLLGSGNLSSFAGEHPGTISQVTVFQDRAEIVRTLETTLDHGIQAVTVTGLPPHIDRNSVRINASGPAGLKIAGLDITRKYHSETQKETIRDLEIRLQEAQDRLKTLENEALLVKSQQEFFQSIRAMAARGAQEELSGKPVSVADYQAAATYAFDGLAGSLSREQTNEIARRGIQKEITKLQNELRQLQSQNTRESLEAGLSFLVTLKGLYQIELSYQLHGASWYPVYDARFDPGTEKLEWTYGANVVQRTGEDWKGVKIILSTARPELGAGAPELNPWVLGIREPVVYEKKERARMHSGYDKAADEEMAGEGLAMETSAVPPAAAQPMESIVASFGSSLHFEIPNRWSIPGDGTLKRVTISTHDFTTATSYRSTPKLSPHAYLTAKVINGSDRPFLPGEVRSFNGTEYVGSSRIEVIVPGEEFDLALGTDDRIKVEREETERHRESAGLFQDKVRYRFGYRIKLENRLDHDAFLTLRDQVPVSHDERIGILDLKTNPKSSAPDSQGLIEWDLTLKPDEKRDVILSFIVEYPDKMDVFGL